MSPALPFSMFAASAVSQKQPFCPTLKSVGPRQIYEAWSELLMLWIHCQQMALPINSHLYIVHPTGVIVKTRCTTNQSHQSELHQNEDRIVRIVRQLHLKKWNASQLIETSRPAHHGPARSKFLFNPYFKPCGWEVENLFNVSHKTKMCRTQPFRENGNFTTSKEYSHSQLSPTFPTTCSIFLWFLTGLLVVWVCMWENSLVYSCFCPNICDNNICLRPPTKGSLVLDHHHCIP